MALVWLVVLAICLHMIYLMAMVGKARGTYEVKAPATTGNEMFERHYRVHMNAVEQSVLIFPLLAACASTGSPTIAAALGAVYLLGRILYSFAYVKDPTSRGKGMMLGFLAQIGLLVVSMVNLVF